MTIKEKGRLARRFARLPTGLKMLLILGVGLLPLGIVALLATMESARENRARGEIETRAAVALSAQRINSAITRSTITIRAASPGIRATEPGTGICRQTLARLAEVQPSPGRYALFGANNAPRCATPDFSPVTALSASRGQTQVEISEDGSALRFVLFAPDGTLEGAGEFPREAVARIAAPSALPGNFDLELMQGERAMTLLDNYIDGILTREVRLRAPVADGQLDLWIAGAAMPLRPAELLMLLLPVMMLVSAAVIGWLVLDRLLLRPLARMQKAVANYRPGDRDLDLPALTTPAREIGALGHAFEEATRTVARHEEELEAAVERQKKLVREVHHRVKNNLQVVASLLNLHSRGSRNEEVAAAYASIQRRVDALAVVHRNHYAELEENRGVALKPLISELGANLRATAPASAAHMQVKLDIAPFHTTQDTAVSIAFLVTEIVEFGMLCGASSVAIALEGNGPGSALLSVDSDSLAGEVTCNAVLFERFDRIVTGLARQLRSTLTRDAEAGRYSVGITVVDRPER